MLCKPPIPTLPSCTPHHRKPSTHPPSTMQYNDSPGGVDDVFFDDDPWVLETSHPAENHHHHHHTSPPYPGNADLNSEHNTKPHETQFYGHGNNTGYDVQSPQRSDDAHFDHRRELHSTQDVNHSDDDAHFDHDAASPSECAAESFHDEPLEADTAWAAHRRIEELRANPAYWEAGGARSREAGGDGGGGHQRHPQGVPYVTTPHNGPGGGGGGGGRRSAGAGGSVSAKVPGIAYSTPVRKGVVCVKGRGVFFGEMCDVVCVKWVVYHLFEMQTTKWM